MKYFHRGYNTGVFLAGIHSYSKFRSGSRLYSSTYTILPHSEIVRRGTFKIKSHNMYLADIWKRQFVLKFFGKERETR